MFAKIFKGARSGQPGAGGVKHPGMKQKDNPDADLVNVGDSWNGGNGQPEKMHAIPRPVTNPVKGGKEYAAVSSVLGNPTGTGFDGQKAYFSKDYSKSGGPAAAKKLHTALSKLGFTGVTYDREDNPTRYTKMGVTVDVSQGETKAGYRIMAEVTNLGLIGASKKHEGLRAYFGL